MTECFSTLVPGTHRARAGAVIMASDATSLTAANTELRTKTHSSGLVPRQCTLDGFVDAVSPPHADDMLYRFASGAARAAEAEAASLVLCNAVAVSYPRLEPIGKH